MEDLDDTILEELKAKAIERGDDDISVDENTLDPEGDIVETQLSPVSVDHEPKKKSKKVRSEKQKAAFEKARLARSENIRIKREIAAEKKAEKKKEKEAVKAEVEKRLKQSPAPAPNPSPAPARKPSHRQVPTPLGYEQQVVNNYYYGYMPEDAELPPLVKQKKKRRKIPPPPESETESESEEESGEDNFIYSDEEPEMPQSYKDLQNYQEEVNRPPPPEHPQLKFRFA
jgi:hypothetical protein